MKNSTKPDYTGLEKVKIFTHNDLDGIGCEIVGTLAFDEVSTTACSYDKIDGLVLDFLLSEESNEYDYILITDISVNDVVAAVIEQQFQDKVRLYDHHATASWLNTYDWAQVNGIEMIGNEVVQSSGTSLLYEATKHLFQNKHYNHALQVFVEKVRRYDTWDWKNVYDDNIAGQLNDLYWILGRKRFVTSMIKKFTKDPFYSIVEGEWREMFKLGENLILDVHADAKAKYIKKASKRVTIKSVKGFKVGIVFAEQHISELGNDLAKEYKEVDFMAIINMASKSVSLRSIKDDVHLGKDIASHFNGGGHAKAAGFEINKDNIMKALKLVIPQNGLAMKAVSRFVYKMVDKII